MATENDVTLLYDRIRDYLDFTLVVMTNRTYWEEMDTVSDDDIRMYNDTLVEAINECYEKYKGTMVETILEQMEYAISTSIRTGMRTPYPRFHNDNYSVDRHIDRVLDNTMRIVDEFYDDLMYEMFIANRQVRKIQDYWKRAISNPAYMVCRVRLMKEWVEFDLTIKRVLEAHPSLSRQEGAITA
jgi:hypothetical protein